MGKRHHLNTQHEINHFLEDIAQLHAEGKRVCVEYVEADRTPSQNNMIYHLYRQIAEQKRNDGWSFDDVRNYCKLHFGIPILRSNDPDFCQQYDEKVKGLDYETKLFIISHMDVTSDFTVAEASEYIDTIIDSFQRQGCYLADPRQA